MIQARCTADKLLKLGKVEGREVSSLLSRGGSRGGVVVDFGDERASFFFAEGGVLTVFRGWSGFAGVEPETAAQAQLRGRLGTDLLEVRAILQECCELDILGMDEMLDRRSGNLVGFKKSQEQRGLAEVAAPALTKFAGR